jgi:hypothetical protein
MSSQVSGEVELKCLRLLGGLPRVSLDGVPRLPFYRPREGPGVHKREKGKEEREKTRGREPWCCVTLLLPQADPAGPADDNGGAHTSRPCPSLVLQAGAAGQSWRPVPSWHAVWSTDPLTGVARGFKQHCVGPPDAVGDVS